MLNITGLMSAQMFPQAPLQKTTNQLRSELVPAQMLKVLEERFRLNNFRRGQKEIISSILSGQDVLAVLPTGGGKSLCYQYPAVFRKKLVIVISPLVALMRDQVSNLRKVGIQAGCLYSAQTEEEKRDVFSRLRNNPEFILYLSPERAHKEGFREWIRKQDVALFAVDEAHCVSQWGHDFREEYSQLSFLKELRPDVPILALTASATPVVLDDIAKNLKLKKPERHIHGFYRKNLYYQVQFCADEEAKLLFLLQSLRQTPSGRVLIYCGTRKYTEEVCYFLQKKFEGVGFYHAGMSADQRTEVQTAYEQGAIRILVATNAFGMGIDHPDVRLVVHYQMPGNIDALYQEMGRAGRDGKSSTCLMLYSKKDKGLQSFFIQQSKAPGEIKSARYRNLDALVNYAEGSECRHAEILTYYRDAYRIDQCGHCDACDGKSERRIQEPRFENFFTPSPKPAAKVRKTRAQAKDKPILEPLQEELLISLKAWRKQKAKELDQPAFVIFSDRTLIELAVSQPLDISALANIHGFGETKTERFGAEVIAILRSFS